MRGIEGAVAIAAAVLFTTAAWASESCERMRGISLPLEPFEQVYLVPIAVDGTPRKFLLEFDAAFSKLDETVAASLALPLKPVPRFIGVSDEAGRFTKIATAPTIGLGPVMRKNAEFLIGPHRASWGAADGAAGQDVFSGFDIELDLKHNRLGVYLPRSCDFTLFWPAEVYGDAAIEIEPTGGIHLPMKLDGQAIEVKLRTSAKRSYMSLSAARALFGIEKDNPALIPIGNRDTGEALYRYPFKTLAGGDKVTVVDPEIFIYENSGGLCGGKADRQSSIKRCWGSGDLIVGTNLLSKLHLFFAFKERKAYFTLSEPGAGKAEARPAP